MKPDQNHISSASNFANEVDILQLISVLWRGKLSVLLVAFLSTAGSIYFAYFFLTPIYTTTAHIVQETENEPVVDFSAALAGAGGGADQSAINTAIEVLRSRQLIEQLVIDLDLKSDPEFNLELLEPSPFSIESVINKFRSWINLQPIPERILTDQQILDSVVDELRTKLNVSNIRQTYVFSITTETESAIKSALVANTLAELYIRYQLETKASANSEALDWLSERLAELRIDLEEAEVAVKDFNAATDLINEETLAAINRQVKELRERLAEERVQETELQSLLLAYQTDNREPAHLAEIAQDALLNRYRDQFYERENNDRREFDERFAQIVSQTELEIQRRNSQIESLEISIIQQEKEADEQSSDLLTLQQLQREATASGVLYEFFLSRLKETSVKSGIQEADSRVLSRAVVPLEPSAPRKALIVILGSILGLVVGSILVVLKELRQSTFRASEELEANTGVTVLGQIPQIPAGARAKILKYLSDKPASAAAEAIRNLRTSLLLSDPEHQPQVIMSTSSIPGEGKTTNSLGLAQNLAGLEKKVLLIEGDIRKLVFAEYFNLSKKLGLISVLNGSVNIEEAVVFEPTLNADVLIGERSSTNPADLFSSIEFDKFLKQMRKQYDYIIIDTPPVLAVPDARVIGRSVDAVIYTVKWDSTTQRQVTEGLKSLQNVGVKVSGLVLAQINPKGQKRYGYGDTSTNYGSYHEN